MTGLKWPHQRKPRLGMDTVEEQINRMFKQNESNAVSAIDRAVMKFSRQLGIPYVAMKQKATESRKFGYWERVIVIELFRLMNINEKDRCNSRRAKHIANKAKLNSIEANKNPS